MLLSAVVSVPVVSLPVVSVPVHIRFPSIFALFLFFLHGSTDDNLITLNAP